MKGDQSLFQMLTFEEVVNSLHGRIGKTKLREHLKSLPLFKGRPTHRRIGKKLLFSPEDLKVLLESLENCSASSNDQAGKRFTSAAPSAASASMRALELLTGHKRKSSALNERQSSGRKVFTAGKQQSHSRTH
ncbi:hypothetical protein CGLAMM_02555 [Acetobacteraceae bacterium EV16G]|uniref:Uncharacterized protein n=1 Tax=Sorlinia euscelidii TaxID=3081148 RepID=A0ABU7U108_9PROT